MSTKIYIASKAKWRISWRSLRSEGFNIISRWIDTPDTYIGTTLTDGSNLDYIRLWTECFEDVMACDVLVCFVAHGEVLKGALIEIGIALGAGKRIILIGSNEAILANGTWSCHPAIEVAPVTYGISDVLRTL